MTDLSKPLKVSLYNKIHRASSCLNFYVVREWKFVSNNPIQLLEEMSVEDRRDFNFDVREINWESYVTNYILGCRRFLLKDNIQTLQTARRNLSRYFLDFSCVQGGLLVFINKIT